VTHEPQLLGLGINVKSPGTAPAQCGDPQPTGNFLDFTYSFTDAAGKNNGNVQSWTAAGQQAFTRSYTGVYPERRRRNAAGNHTAEPGKTYTYYAENRLTAINGGAVATYVYDAGGRRVRKVASGTTTEYIYDLSGAVVAEKVGTTWTKGYVMLGGQMLAQYDGVLGAGGATTYFAHADHLGSTRVLTTVTATLHESYDYYPFGELIGSGTATTRKFTGHQRDTESNLDFFGARYFAPIMGRFMSPDPLQGSASHLKSPQRWNRYAYTQNNPLNRVDIGGYFDIHIHETITGAALRSPGLYSYFRRGGNIVSANKSVDWTVNHSRRSIQKEHFLATGGLTQRKSYDAAVGYLSELSREAFRKSNSGDVKGADQAIGRALHAIQDGFAHTTRNAEGKITQIEYYGAGNSGDGAPRHDHPDTFEGSQFSFEIQGATDASIAYLQLMKDSAGMTAPQFAAAFSQFVQTFFGWAGKEDEPEDEDWRNNRSDLFRNGFGGNCGIKTCENP